MFIIINLCLLQEINLSFWRARLFPSGRQWTQVFRNGAAEIVWLLFYVVVLRCGWGSLLLADGVRLLQRCWWTVGPGMSHLQTAGRGTRGCSLATSFSTSTPTSWTKGRIGRVLTRMTYWRWFGTCRRWVEERVRQFPHAKRYLQRSLRVRFQHRIEKSL